MFIAVVTLAFALQPPGEQDDKANAIDAPSVSKGDVRVSVPYAAVTSVRYRDAAGKTQRTGGPLLTLVLSIENSAPTKKLSYIGWQNDERKDGECAMVEDEHGNEYASIAFGTGTSVFHQTASRGSIYPNKPYFDVLVFEPPIESFKKITLTLPGKNVGLDDDLTIAIPASRLSFHLAAERECFDGQWFIEVGSKSAPVAAKPESKSRKAKVRRAPDESKQERLKKLEIEAAETKAADDEVEAEERKKRNIERSKNRKTPKPIVGVPSLDPKEKSSKSDSKKRPALVTSIALLEIDDTQDPPIAFVRTNPGRKVVKVKEGDMIGAWKIKSVVVESEKIIVIETARNRSKTIEKTSD